MRIVMNEQIMNEQIMKNQVTGACLAKLGYLSSSRGGLVASRDGIVVSNLRCGRSNRGSNLGHGILFCPCSFCGLRCNKHSSRYPSDPLDQRAA